MMGRFDGQGVIVTGGAKGIGRRTAARFAAEGAWVAIWDVDHSAGLEAAAEVERVGGQALVVEVDVGIRAQVERAFARTVEWMPNVTVLINNAAIMIHGEFLDLPDEAWETVLRTNLKAAFLCSQTVARYWVAGGIAGRIVNITSVDAAIVHLRFPHYCVAKAGLRMLTQASALALAPHGIRVNELAPGFITPGMASRIVASPEWPSQVQSFVPLGRAGQADEIAAAACYLASDEASYVTGAVLVVDGGHSIGAEDWILREFYREHYPGGRP